MTNENRTIHWYMEKAMELQQVNSQRKLAYLLDISPSSCNAWATGKSHPSPEQMIKLAKFAGISREVALAELGYWTHFDTPAAPIYKKMANHLAQMSGVAASATVGAAMLFTGLGGNFDDFDGGSMSVNEAGTFDQNTAGQNLYYGK